MKRFLVFSVAGHGAFVLLIFLTAAILSRPKTGIYSVDLLSSLPAGQAGGAAVPVEQPPAPKAPPIPIPTPKAEPIKAPPKEALKIPDKKKKNIVAKAKPPVKPVISSKTPKPHPNKASEEPLPAETSGNGGVGANGNGGLGGAGIVAEAGQTFPYPWYMKAIADKLDAQWNPENFQPDTVCKITFIIHRDGQVTEAAISKASDDSVFDQLALRAVLYASPFPPLPGGYPEDRLNVHMTFKGKGS